MLAQCWTAVVLTLLLAEHIVAVNQNRLSDIVNGIYSEYGTQGMFSLAVNVPVNQNVNINQVLQQVFNSDPPNDVRNTINNHQVYVGSRVVAAKVYNSEHAESRVVDHLDTLFNSRTPNDLLLFYVYASPCVERCSSATNPQSILPRIQLMREWTDWVFVFSVIFSPPTRPGSVWQGNTDQQRRRALQRLGGSVGLNKIFRCDGNPRVCTSCFDDGQVTGYCVSG